MLLGAIALAAMVSSGQSPRLEYVKPIGVGWNTDKWGWMSFVAFSPDGREVASDGATRPDDVSENLSFWTFPGGHFNRKVSITPPFDLSADWKYYVSGQTVRLLSTGRPLFTLGGKQFDAFAFSPDSRYAADALQPMFGERTGFHPPVIRIFELPSGKQVNAFGVHLVSSLAFGPDGKTLAAGYWKIVVLRNMFTGARLATLRGFGRYVESLSFSPDGSYLAAGTDAGDVQIWNLRSRRAIQTLQLGGQFVSAPAFSPNSRLLAFGIYGTGTVWLVGVQTGKVLDHKKISDLGCGSVAFSPDGRYLITPSTGGLIKWPYDRGGTIRVFKVVTR
ncbi:MAG TPA: hypothetical protein VMA34_11555 [Terracidiphilus sp.]|nr:hypothetical protein [Terracidiphilus sp.]